MALVVDQFPVFWGKHYVDFHIGHTSLCLFDNAHSVRHEMISPQDFNLYFLVIRITDYLFLWFGLFHTYWLPVFFCKSVYSSPVTIFLKSVVLLLSRLSLLYNQAIIFFSDCKSPTLQAVCSLCSLFLLVSAIFLH